VNSYKIFLTFVNKEFFKSVILLTPGIVTLAFVLIGTSTMFRRGSPSIRFDLVFLILLLLSSLIPETFLGKVSETYAISSLWPLAVLLGVVTSWTMAKSPKNIYLLLPFLIFLIIANSISTKQKVKEIVQSSNYAHGIRGSMKQVSASLSCQSKILVFHKPRPKEAFGRFGSRGVDANGGLYFRGRRHKWIGAVLGQEQKSHDDYDVILKEDEQQKSLCVLKVAVAPTCLYDTSYFQNMRFCSDRLYD